MTLLVSLLHMSSGPDGIEEKGSDRLVTASPATMSEAGDEHTSNTESEELGPNGSYEVDHEAEEALGEHHDEEDNSGSDTDGDEEDEDDEEPALKYERLGGITHNLLQKDSASALAYANQRLVRTSTSFYYLMNAERIESGPGNARGMLHILDLAGQHIKSFEPHSASVSDVSMDVTAEFVATASIDVGARLSADDIERGTSGLNVYNDTHKTVYSWFLLGQVVVYSLSTPETYTFNMKRSLRTLALEPNFAKSGTRSLVCGGMAGTLVLHEKGWLGYKETVLHSGEGPIWQVRWKDRLIAWANDLGVKIYDTNSQSRITFIDRPADSPRADLFKCSLHWQDESTLLIAWADQIKVARIRARPRSATSSAHLPPLLVEITAVFQLDCMIAGIVPHPTSTFASADALPTSSAASAITAVTRPTLTTFLILAYSPPDSSLLTGNEATPDRAEQVRKAAERPELRIISRVGEELAADALGITGFERWSCNDYVLVEIDAGPPGERYYIVLSPKDVVVVKPRDWKDHVTWLVERQRYEEALEEIERRHGQPGVSVVGLKTRWMQSKLESATSSI
ncbi:Vacuolar protein sorting-associated protein 41 [Grifola frondosa]|uniref:Vacuolar protein sorting-associated protein 41 n=1 Tax=Grifola frondosa TaxID=5627 RepID=A0A1C7M075_GRIFR|nr:Vacuolar protein sorting-associated protein 41 [Grifola frondosa]